MKIITGQEVIGVLDNAIGCATDEETIQCLEIAKNCVSGYKNKELYSMFVDEETIKKENEQIMYALEYLHDADLSEYGEENIKALEMTMRKFGIEFDSKL